MSSPNRPDETASPRAGKSVPPVVPTQFRPPGFSPSDGSDASSAYSDRPPTLRSQSPSITSQSCTPADEHTNSSQTQLKASIQPMASVSQLRTPAWSTFPTEVDSSNSRHQGSRQVRFHMPHSSSSDSRHKADDERQPDFDDDDLSQPFADLDAWAREYEAEHIRRLQQEEQASSPVAEDVTTNFTFSFPPDASLNGATEHRNSPQLRTPVPLRPEFTGRATASLIPRRVTSFRSFIVDGHTGLWTPIQDGRSTRLRRRWSGSLESLTLPPSLDDEPGHAGFPPPRDAASSFEEIESMVVVRHADLSDDFLDVRLVERGRTISRRPSYRTSGAPAPSAAHRPDFPGAWPESPPSAAEAITLAQIANERWPAHRDDRLTEFIIESIGEVRGRLDAQSDIATIEQITTFLISLQEHVSARRTESPIESIIEMLEQLHRRLTDDRLEDPGNATNPPLNDSIFTSTRSSITDLDLDASPLLPHEMLSVADIAPSALAGPADHRHVQVLLPAFSSETQHLGSWARMMTQVAIGEHVLAHAEQPDVPNEPPPPYTGRTPSPPAVEIRLPSPGAESDSEDSVQSETVDCLTAALAAHGLVEGDEAVVSADADGDGAARAGPRMQDPSSESIFPD